MNTTLATPVGRTEHQHPPSSTSDASWQRQRVGLVDRLALRLGVALVAWSRRPRELDSRDRLARRVERELTTEQRERQMQRLMLQLLPPR
ncbi:MAG: hypothetical protein KIT89_00695 [Microcella sp.]|uniref:hypothetical protein n=1 Tax=Microcella sp. TaxID=1913979 RepID=UPI0024CD0D60|nr:hypothetical protein [Microcella sp.]UYN83796.1 MAG: hypothetical protein KIT89_00695 [Microcella sp.]